MSGEAPLSPLDRLEAWWNAPAPAERLAAVRALVGLYCLVYFSVRAPALMRVAHFDATRFRPVGLAQLLTGPVPAGLHQGLVVLALLGALAFALGWRYRITAPLFALTLLWVLTYRQSWGHLSHSNHLVMVHVLLLSLLPAADAWSLDARAGRREPGDPGAYGAGLHLLMLTVVISYMLAGWAKLEQSGFGWLDGTASRNQIAHDVLRRQRLGGYRSPVAVLFLRQPWAFTLVALGTMIVELGAFVAMARGRIRQAWVLGAWLLHAGIYATMTISFWYPLTGVAFASFFPLEQAWRRIRGQTPSGADFAAPSPSGPH